MVTITFSVSRSSFTSSTTPLKLAKGPSVMRTDSFFSNLIFIRGLSLETSVRKRIELTSCSLKATGFSPVPRKPGTPRAVFITCPQKLVQVHLYQHITREKHPLDGTLLAVKDFSDGLGRNHHPANPVLQAKGFYAALNRFLHLALKPGVGMDDVPLEAIVGRWREPFRWVEGRGFSVVFRHGFL